MAATPGDETEARMTLELGRRISALRKERGLTMVALAARTELSQPFLSQIERGRARPSMPSLHRLASALGTTTPALLSGGERGVGSAAEIDDDAVSLVRVDQGSMVTQSNGQAKALVVGEREMYPLEFVTNVTEFEDYYQHPGAEFIFVISGHLEVDLAEKGIHRIGPGDTLYFAGGVSHRWRVVGLWPARLLVTQSGTSAPRASDENITVEHI
ncbi:helix-turn-helix domain-containing protein [Microbacterium sp. HA-8]|jgi:transcriptional regulator with XRE-family HTH domain|uniref:helix-turn-helix domain-containing protein n=1 Tax=unclassified Microbacterium TaxID=2609290 RepID=UPI0025F23A24|nr:XRE family transcriptional regulator [Microbacterium sp.]